MVWLSLLFFIVGIILAYWFLILPLIKDRPRFREFYEHTESFWTALWMKLSTIKTKLAATLLIIANGLVIIHDVLIPLITDIDWSPITKSVPPFVWPIISLADAALFLWLRHVTATAAADKIVAVESGVITAEQAIKADDASAEVAVMTMKEAG